MHKKKKSAFEHVAPKTSFWLGFGLAIVAFFIVGFFVMLAIFIRQMEPGEIEHPSPGDIPPVVVDDVRPEPPAAAPSMAALAQITDADHVRGSEDAEITVIEFSDVQCSYCAKFHETMKQIVADYGGKVNWVYRHFPLESIHPQARPAASAAECAGEQGKFWEFLDEAVANQGSLGDDYYLQLAGTFNLDLGDFKTCVASGKYNTLITQQSAQAAAAGGGGTPHSVIVAGDTILPVRGAVPVVQLKSMIDPLLGGK